MLRDVFYYGDKPNAHPREKFAKSLDDARQQATTEHFWIINEFCDYKDFDWDFDFELLHDSDVWAIDHNNVWPSLYQKDSGTWLCPKVESSIVVYRADVEPLKRKNILSSNWKIESEVDVTKFDFGWHPDPADPPYIYKWGCKFFPVEIHSFLEYHTPGATNVKYLTDTVDLLPQYDRWVELDKIDTTKFDFSWRPDPREPAFIYVWGNKFVDGRIQSTLEYHVPGATQKKYMDEPVEVLPLYENWVEKDKVDPLQFDFSWRPNPTEPPFIYIWGNKFVPGELQSTLEYHVPGAKEKKYMAEPVEVLPLTDCWTEYQPVDKDSFDMSWRPDPREPPFIYVWGNKYIPGEIMPTLEFTVPGATLKKYIQEPVPVLPHFDRINIVQKLHEKHLDTESEGFNISWRPDPRDPPFIYVWGNKYIPGEIKPTLEYRVPGATKIKYMTELLDVEPEWHRWVVKIPIDKEKNLKNGFDFSWRPNPNEPPYIYTWGNKHVKAEDKPTLEYHVEGATDRKYMGNNIETLPDWDRWRILKNVDKSSFDFSWIPNPNEPPYIYRFGNQHYDARTMPTIEYHTPGSHLGEYKYIDDVRAELLPNPDRFEHYDYVYGLDYSWVPNPNDPPYIYVWGNQWNKPEDRASIKYVVPGATEFKYMEERVTRKPVMDNWITPPNIDTSDFDFSWEPNPNDPPYIYQFGTQWQKTGGPRYVIAGATEIKYVDVLKAKALPDKSKFQPVGDFKIKDFDYSWHPDNTEHPFIYMFGNKYYNAEKMPTVKYTVPGATEIKYINDVAASLEHDKTNFKINIPIDESKFDFGWVPDPNDPPYIYVFGNQWNDGTIEPTVEYHVEGATEKKYINFIKATVLPDMSDNWDVPDNVDKDSFDFSWRPNPKDNPYIYVFGTTYHDVTSLPALYYKTPEATQLKYITDVKAKFKHDYTNWIIPDDIEREGFDFGWVPDPNDPPFIYEFGTQWQKTGGPRYVVPDAKEVKYVDAFRAKKLPNMSNWEIPTGIDVSNFDFSWHPDSTEPERIYQFGTLENDNDGPRYIFTTDKTKELETVRLLRVNKEEHSNEMKISKYVIQTTLDDLVKDHPNEIFWALNKNIDYTNFDFTWRPSIEQARYVHVFGSPDYPITHTYFVSAAMYLQGNKDFNYLEKDKKLESGYLAKLFNRHDMFYIDRGNIESGIRFDQLQKLYPNIQKTRFTNSWVDTINRCIKKSTTPLCWILNSELDYTDFDFDYYPTQWQMKMIHVFGTQWSHWGTTVLVNCETFPEYTKYVKILEHLQNINFVKDRKAKATNNLYDIYLVDHGNPDVNDIKLLLETKSNGRPVTVVKLEDTYFNTIKSLLQSLPDKKDHYIWLCNSVCDYTDFDFSYICDPFARDNLHVFPTENQKYGDTFFIDVNTTKALLDHMTDIEDYTKLNFNYHQRAKRLSPPKFVTTDDSHANHIKHDFEFPYAIYCTEDIEVKDEEPIALWNKETKNILVTTTGATRIIVPKEAKSYIKNELYDYPYIKTVSKIAKSKPLDIVYLSNGEKEAEINYEHLLRHTKNAKNRIVRVDGINGRVQAYHAALEASETSWAFTVFAKLKVNESFDWNWQPDRLQMPKHYIFNAINPLNGLIYGHQAMIAYNKKLVLANKGLGLDFTLDDPHESVDIISGTANFNTDEYSTWRTAFREVIKLQSAYDDISKQRLKTWLLDAKGKYSKQCLLGSFDAVEYYKSVNGDIDKLKLSYEWDWLTEYYNRKYN